MKNRKWLQMCMAGVLSAAVLTTSVSVWGADFSDGADVPEAVVVEENTAEETEAPEFEAELFSAEDARASELSISKTYFPDSAFRAYISEKADKDGNGKLSSTEIQDTTEIIAKNMGIADLKGIERFPYLKTLNVSGNKLKTVDLTKNTKLQFIKLSENSLSGTLDLSKCTGMMVIDYSKNALSKVTMPSYKYLKKVEKIDASHNKFKSQTYAGLKYINTKYMPVLIEVYANDNYMSTFSCSGYAGMILDLRNNRITTLSGGSYGYQATGILLDGKYNTLSNTKEVNFAALGNRVPQRFSCNPEVRSKVKMVTPRLSVTTDNKDKITVTVGASSGDASYKLERKKGNGSYAVVRTWAAGELDDPEFGENQYIDTNVTEGEKYTYRLTVSLDVQNENRVNVAWPATVSKEEAIFNGVPKMTSRVSDKKGYATIKWDKVPGADGYAVYYGINSKASHALTRGTSKTYAIKSKLTSGRTYYFRVRAFKYVNGERKYAPFCTAKSLKIK